MTLRRKLSYSALIVEAVNAAGMSYGSSRLRILAGEVAAYQPDLIIFFEGHNEFVERHLADLAPGSSGTVRALRGLLDRWRLYAVMTRIWLPLTNNALAK